MGKKEKIKKRRIGPVGEILLATIAVTGTVTFFAIFPGVTVLLAPFIKKNKTKNSKQIITRSVNSLIRAGLVEKVVEGGEEKLTLTRKGRWETALRSNKDINKKPKWDGVWRIVVFDIPQSKYKLRDELRRAMKMYGFRILQQSVWVYPHPCDDFITLVKDHLGVEEDVLYIKAGYIENDKHLRKEFKI